MSDRKILVTGASGKLGKQVVSYLLEDFAVSPSQLIVTTRKAESLKALADKGVDVREADFANPDSLVEAFKGASSLLLISIDAAGPRTQPHLNAVAAAEQAGVEHIAYTSMPAAEQSPVVFAHEHEATEKAIKDSAIANATIMRNNWYFENIPEYFASILQTGHWLTSAEEGRSAQLSRKDLAYAAAAALVSPAKGIVTLLLNGGKSQTHAEMAQLMDKVLGTSINMVNLTDDQYQSQLETFGLPEPIIALCTTMDHHNRENLSDGTSEAFEQLTGRKPQSFEAWLEANKTELQKLANL
ncbi:SDR family NAD(P)-dependent oxidoreductase [Photobacterium sanctipauli]|uniref:SDR family NAD(P)-dependent oxidoreductase n=1 Tax=Photobacterium sanctipauli TaxID=1342794 RepID=A0A2T3N7T6_9GAMM|nr:SDR family oxidoreductase [Photobacterium sanctipauli]PSW09156.1 SDR family NAD(P)-dependent oxidoreductase [Photobacterium sanctipauli]